MNIKINDDELALVSIYIQKSYTIGSRLYNTHTDESDYDTLFIVEPFLKSDTYYPNNHQLQYDSSDGRRQHMFTTKERFYRNLFSGESTINADVIMFTDFDDLSDSERLNYCRTYNVIKSFLKLISGSFKAEALVIFTTGFSHLKIKWIFKSRGFD